jgi:Phage capsid family
MSWRHGFPPNRWFINGQDFIALRKLKDGTESSKYLLESDVTCGPTYRLFGVPVAPTNKLSVGTAILVDTSMVAIARDLAPSVTLLSERYAEYDEQAIRVVTRYDLGLLHPEGVIVLTAGGSWRLLRLSRTSSTHWSSTAATVNSPRRSSPPWPRPTPAVAASTCSILGSSSRRTTSFE